MTYVMKPRNAAEIVAVVGGHPVIQFRVRAATPPALLVTTAGDHFVLARVDAMHPGRWFYTPAEPVEVEIPPQWDMEGRAPNASELADMDPAERADWEERTRDTPSLPQEPPPSEY